MLEPSQNNELPPIPPKRYFAIGEVSELCAVKPHVLRYWEQEFPQLKPVKRRGNRRYYQHQDVLTIRQSLGDVTDKHLVFVGDGNNVAHSLALICAMLQMRFTLACPDGYTMDQEWIARVRAKYPDASVGQNSDPHAAVSDADAIYTDVWTSMGQESEAAARKTAFAAYQVNGELMKAAPDHARVLHCLPAVRGEEITDEVIDGPQSDVIAQAGNRMHAQKGLLVWLLGRDWIDQNVSVDCF